MSTTQKEPFLLQFEEQERRFSPKKRMKEEAPEDDSSDLELDPKSKLPRFEGISTSIENFNGTFKIPTVRQVPDMIPSSTTEQGTHSDRASRNIAHLCTRIAEELRKRPQTRDELSNSTGFARQRICTVISVFKAIGLVNIRDSNTRRSEIEWNEEQAQVLPQASVYTSKLLELRANNAQLSQRESELIKQSVQQTHHHNLSLFQMGTESGLLENKSL